MLPRAESALDTEEAAGFDKVSARSQNPLTLAGGSRGPPHRRGFAQQLVSRPISRSRDPDHVQNLSHSQKLQNPNSRHMHSPSLLDAVVNSELKDCDTKSGLNQDLSEHRTTKRRSPRIRRPQESCNRD